MELFLDAGLGYCCGGEDLSSRGEDTDLSAHASTSESKDSKICKHCLTMPNIVIIQGHLVIEHNALALYNSTLHALPPPYWAQRSERAGITTSGCLAAVCK